MIQFYIYQRVPMIILSSISCGALLCARVVNDIEAFKAIIASTMCRRRCIPGISLGGIKLTDSVEQPHTQQ